MEVSIDPGSDSVYEEIEYVDWMEEDTVPTSLEESLSNAVNSHDQMEEVEEDFDQSEITRLHGCQHCPEKFHFSNDLRDHEDRYHKFTCGVCFKVVGTKEQLDAHVQAHTDPKSGKVKTTFHCDLCPQIFLEDIFLRNHKQKMHQLPTNAKETTKKDELDELWICDVCDKKFDTEELYKQHLIVHEENLDACLICHKKWRHLDEMINHMKYHKKKKKNKSMSFHCAICNCGFSKENQLVTHTSVHIPAPKTCSSCQKVFINKYHLDQHADRAHHPWKFLDITKVPQRNYEDFVCVVCKVVSADFEFFMRHAALHGVSGCYICAICGEILTQKFALFHHFVETHRMTQKEVQFYLKNYGNPDEEKVERYPISKKAKKADNEGEKVTCKYLHCGKIFTDEDFLEKHMISHENNRIISPLSEIFLCQICTKVFTDKQSLTEHALLHASEGLNHCGACGQKFSGRKSVEAHLNFGDHCRVQAWKKAVTVDKNPVVKSKTVEPKPTVASGQERINEVSTVSSRNVDLSMCSFCRKIFLNKKCLRLHYYDRHQEEIVESGSDNVYNSVFCVICNGVFDQEEIKSHVLCHLDKGDLICPLCGEGFKFTNHLNNHMQNYHKSIHIKDEPKDIVFLKFAKTETTETTEEDEGT